MYETKPTTKYYITAKLRHSIHSVWQNWPLVLSGVCEVFWTCPVLRSPCSPSATSKTDRSSRCSSWHSTPVWFPRPAAGSLCPVQIQTCNKNITRLAFAIKNYSFQIHCNILVEFILVPLMHIIPFHMSCQLPTAILSNTCTIFSWLTAHYVESLYRFMAGQQYVRIMSLVLRQTFSSVRMLLAGGCSILKKASPCRMALSSCFRASSCLRCPAICFKANSVLSVLSNGPEYARAKPHMQIIQTHSNCPHTKTKGKHIVQWLHTQVGICF